MQIFDNCDKFGRSNRHTRHVADHQGLADFQERAVRELTCSSYQLALPPLPGRSRKKLSGAGVEGIVDLFLPAQSASAVADNRIVVKE